MIRVAIIEDEPQWQAGIKAILNLLPAYELVGVYPNAKQAKTAFSQTKADVYLMDWKLGEGEDGLAVAAYLVDELGQQPWQILMTTGSPIEQLPSPLPYGYVGKANIARDLVTKILEVAERLKQ